MRGRSENGKLDTGSITPAAYIHNEAAGGAASFRCNGKGFAGCKPMDPGTPYRIPFCIA
jgi:hypothetical protein